MAVKRPWALREIAEGDDVGILLLARTMDKWFTPQGLQDIGRDLPRHEGFVAARGDRILGFVTWAPGESDVATLSWIGVAEGEQRSGIGTALLAAVVRAAKERGFRTLETSTVADTVDYPPYAATREFYRSRGFADHRVDPKYYTDTEESYDRLVLRLDLSREPTRTTGRRPRP